MQGETNQTLSGIESAYQNLVEAMEEGALVLSVEGTIAYCNHAFAKMLTLSTSRVQGHNLSNFLENPDNERIQQVLLQLPHVTQMEISLRSSDSRSIRTQFCIVERKSDLQDLVCVIVKELSDPPIADIALEDQTKQLAEAIKVLRIFSTMVFHDMRAPLRHIKNFSEILSEHWQETMDDQSRHNLDVISSAVTEIHMIIDNLLYYYKKIIP